jgi:hypothetical protein
MSAFGMIESFFFLSLGVVFVLLMLLVYHFKQRIATIEQKSDTMFDIVQNLAKELTTLKGRLSSSGGGGGVRLVDAAQHVYDDEEDEEDEEDDDDDDDEESDEDDESDEEDEEEDEERVKVIDIGAITPIDPIHETDDSDSEDESPVVELNDSESEKIKVLKVPQQLNNDSTMTMPTSVEDSNMNVYKKMAVGELRTTVISKGLCSDASKLNKVELLKMLSKK